MSRAPERPTDPAPADWGAFSRPPRIVQVRGASGSGKTTLVRQLMAVLGRPQKWYVAGRKKPLTLTFARPGLRPLCVVGNYEAGVATGGVDTITDKETPYRVAREAARQGYDVLLEGIFISIEFWRTLYLHEAGFDRYDVFIDLDVDECTEQVYQRQEKAGKPRTPLKQMADFHPRVLHTRQRLLDAGVPEETLIVCSTNKFLGPEKRVRRTRTEALEKVKELLS